MEMEIKSKNRLLRVGVDTIKVLKEIRSKVDDTIGVLETSVKEESLAALMGGFSLAAMIGMLVTASLGSKMEIIKAVIEDSQEEDKSPEKAIEETKSIIDRIQNGILH